MISSGRLFFWLFNCILLLLTNADDGQPIRGVPGIDYPDYQTIPQTSFRCSEQQLIPGLYADPETGCQMFHHCYEHRHESFLCPSGTIFNQAILACDYWYSAVCSAATSHYNVKLQNKAGNISPKIELAPIKNPSINIFNKLASLYDVKEPLSIDYDSEESNFFSDEDSRDEQTSVSGNYLKHDNNILKVPSIQDRREGVTTETYKDHGYSPYGNKNNDHLGTFDYFESSGEPDDSGEQENYEEFSSLHGSEKPVDFEKQYFGYDEVKDFEHDSEHQLNNEDLFSHFSDIEERKANSSKDHKSEAKLVKRQSKKIDNRYVRKQKRRPIYTIIEHEANIKEFTTTELPKHKMDIHLNNTDDSSSYSQESVTASNSVSTSSENKSKRRKPVLIQLEDSYEYNLDNAKISSIKYGNPHSNIPEFSMDAEEISVKLFPSNNKRKPVDRLMQHQFIETKSDEEPRSLNNIASHKSNIFHASTLSALDNIERFEDISKNLNQVYPKQQKDVIRIIDSENNHDVYTKNEELIKSSTTFTPIFEDDFTTQSSSTGFEDYDKFTKPRFDYQDNEKAHEMSEGNPELGRQIKDNHNVYFKNEELEDATTFTPIYEDEFTTQSMRTDFENFDEFSELHFHDYDLENTREIEKGRSDIFKQTEDDHGVYIENEEINDATTLASIFEDDFTTQSSNTIFKDFDKLFYPTFDDHNIEIDHEIENDHLDLIPEQYEDSYSDLVTSFPHIEMLDGSEDTHFDQVNPGATKDIEEYENKKFIEYIRDFPKYKSFEEIEINNDKEKEDYSFVTTEFSIPEMSSKVLHAEDETDRFYFNPNTVVESAFDDSDTSDSLSQHVSKTSDEISSGIIIASKPFSNHTNEAVKKDIFFKEILRNNVSSEVKPLRAKTLNNVTTAESANVSVDLEVKPLINAENNEYFINENTKDKLNSDLLINIHTETSVYIEENYSSKDSSEQYDSYNTLSDINSKETEDFFEKEKESNLETILHKQEFDQNIHQSVEPTDPGVLNKMELKSIENIDKITETLGFEDSEIDSEDLTKILDDLENYHNVAENDPISDQEHVFKLKHDSYGKAKLEDSSKITPGKSISNIETNAKNKGFSNLPQNNPGNIMKDKPIRIPRMFMPPYNRDFNFERFSRNFNFEKLSSQNFGGVPYSMLQLKQKSMNKMLGSSMNGYGGMKGIEDYYSSRTGDLFESPKISKLISIGKNLLNAKKAKLRILRKYVNY